MLRETVCADFKFKAVVTLCLAGIALSGQARVLTAQDAQQGSPGSDPFDYQYSPELANVMSALSVDRYDEALALLSKLRSRTRSSNDPAFRAELEEAQKRIIRLKRAFKRVEDAAFHLRRNPDDPVANEELGLFYCVEKQDWTNGLPLLLKADNRQIRDAADLDLKRPTDPMEKAKLAIAWLRATAQERDRGVRQSFQLRGRHWYLEARPNLTRDMQISLDKEFDTIPLYADRIVIWNQHNGQAADRGTVQVVVTLLHAGKPVLRKTVALPWKPDAPSSAVVRIPRKKVDAIRVDVTKYRGASGGLGEIEVFDGSVNLAKNCSVQASGYWQQNGQYHPKHLTNGNTSGESGYWLLEDRQTGWATVDLLK